MQPVQFRTAVFTPKLREFSAAQVVSVLLTKLQQFSGDPVVLPIPKEAPPEIPRIVLKNPSDNLGLQIALARADLYANAKLGAEIVSEQVFDEAIAIMEQVLDALHVRPGRLAVLATYGLKCDDPAATLVNHFCKSEWSDGGPLADLESFELHAHRRLALLEGLTVNSWVRCKTGQMSEGKRSFPALAIERDVNTLAEEADDREFDADELASFVRQGSQFLEDEVRRFFPEAQ